MLEMQTYSLSSLNKSLSNQRLSAAASIPGIFSADGAASNATSLGNNFLAVLPRVTNQGGVSAPLNGPQITLFCGLENINVLWTTPIPDCMLCIS